MCRIDAYSMAKRADGLSIGLGSSEVAAALRRLAKGIERGQIIAHRATVQSEASEFEFAKTKLVFEYYERPEGT